MISVGMKMVVVGWEWRCGGGNEGNGGEDRWVEWR
jgi:hypothetical protein